MTVAPAERYCAAVEQHNLLKAAAAPARVQHALSLEQAYSGMKQLNLIRPRACYYHPHLPSQIFRLVRA